MAQLAPCGTQAELRVQPPFGHGLVLQRIVMLQIVEQTGSVWGFVLVGHDGHLASSATQVEQHEIEAAVLREEAAQRP